ncbi:hypothetical protein [Kineothrix sp. MB12-C1]|uniref:hypothetical protein n=1 Tax=Kineothrix sp. MB12-C1 TaxID=3070215 RepID=UPI0027D2E36B|nr:hypothetical protein [Kineothrix sp. MB12-C1]WMC91250.1 hypothetical protein RBB56_10170 [Kineothrix sp. MB12-C1]
MSRILPILFNTEMTKAILGGRKTVTRRLIKPQPYGFFEVNENPAYLYDFDPIRERIYPQYQMGDILYVRETWGNYSDDNPESNATYYLYRADYPNGAKSYMHSDGIHECDFPRWRPSIHMPKEAARIWLKVTDVRAECMRDMTIEDMIREGIDTTGIITTSGPINYRVVNRFEELWDSTVKEDWQKFASNPWVWVYEFERCEKPD